MRRNVALWTVVGALAVFYAVGIAQGWYLAMAAMAAVVLVATPILTVASERDRRARQERLFLDTYGSLDGARAVLDLDALREVRDAQGVVPAVRLVRRRHPAIPLAQAADIVRGL